MKLVVIIPAYNEERSIGKVIREIPKNCSDLVKVVVINDGSTDNTVEIAKEAGVDKIITHKQNKGLAPTFRDGIETALEMGADIIVSIDADRQYDGNEIPKLIQPIIDGKADIVLGSRFKGWIEDMPFRKRVGNKIATRATCFVSGFPVSDAQTGFRAFSREAALQLNILSDYTYVQETIIQAVNKGLKIVEVPIHFRKREGKSRLISGIFNYAGRAGIAIVRNFVAYKPLRVFMWIGGLIFLAGVIAGLRVLIHFLRTGLVSPYIPTAILTTVLLIVGFQIIVLGLVADMVGTNRKIIEEILYRLKK